LKRPAAERILIGSSNGTFDLCGKAANRDAFMLARSQIHLQLKELSEDKEKIVSGITRRYPGERRIGLVIVFDNMDKRSRDVQIAIFDGAQWFKELTRALVIVNCATRLSRVAWASLPGAKMSAALCQRHCLFSGASVRRRNRR
jgi:hypothetical protein